MTTVQVLKEAITGLDGFEFKSVDELCDDIGNDFMPLVKTKVDGIGISPEQARDNISERIKLAFQIYIQNKDVYCRLRGDKAFYHLMMSNWNSDHLAAPYSPGRTGELMNLMIAARRRYLAESEYKKGKQRISDLADTVDKVIAIIDEVDTTIPSRKVLGLNPPEGYKDPKGKKTTRAWPPSHFGQLDIAIMAEASTRKTLFRVDHNNPLDEKDIPAYPDDQDHPVVARKFLCWLALTEIKATSKISIFLAPIAFFTHEKRQDWYRVTGHKSRFYATVNEFIAYTLDEFQKAGKESKNQVMGLLTPWFFEKDEVLADAEEKDRPIPMAWERGCFRAGMVLMIEKVKKLSTTLGYRIVLYRPLSPDHPSLVQREPRKRKQDVWVHHLFKMVRERFEPHETWVGGPVRRRTLRKNAILDSVMASSEFIEAVAKDPATLPADPDDLEGKGLDTVPKAVGYGNVSTGQSIEGTIRLTPTASLNRDSKQSLEFSIN